MAKYNNVKCTYKSFKFDSIGERDRYKELEILQKKGEISKLLDHVKFWFIVKGIKICSYTCDYTYYDKEGNYVVEDFKGCITSEFKRSYKMMWAINDIKVHVTFDPKTKKRNLPKLK